MPTSKAFSIDIKMIMAGGTVGLRYPTPSTDSLQHNCFGHRPLFAIVIVPPAPGLIEKFRDMIQVLVDPFGQLLD